MGYLILIPTCYDYLRVVSVDTAVCKLLSTCLQIRGPGKSRGRVVGTVHVVLLQNLSLVTVAATAESGSSWRRGRRRGIVWLRSWRGSRGFCIVQRCDSIVAVRVGLGILFNQHGSGDNVSRWHIRGHGNDGHFSLVGTLVDLDRGAHHASSAKSAQKNRGTHVVVVLWTVRRINKTIELRDVFPDQLDGELPQEVSGTSDSATRF